MPSDYDVMDSDIDYTAESLDDAVVDNSEDAITQPEFEAEVTSTLSEEVVATTEPVSILAKTTAQEQSFIETANQVMSLSPIVTPAVAPTAVQKTAVAEEKKPLYKNPYAIGAGLLALYFLMNSDD